MKILKFGGTSVGSVDRIKDLILLIKTRINTGEKIAVVLSAMTTITDSLITAANSAVASSSTYTSISTTSEINNNSSKNYYKQILADIQKKHISVIEELIPPAQQTKVLLQVKLWFNDLEQVLNGVNLVGELSNRCLDYIMSFGELLSNFTVSEIFNLDGIEAEFLDARTIIKTDDTFGCGIVDTDISYKLIKEHFQKHTKLQIITGFIASTKNGDTITLGRGGSDYTASIFSAALDAEACEIWTDVDGILTADPRKVSKAFPLKNISYEEAMELSHFGAKVIYPPTMRPALSKKIPIVVRNTFNPNYAGTVVQSDSSLSATTIATDNSQLNRSHKTHLISGISSIANITLIRVQGPGMVGVAGVAARMFSALAQFKVNIILITQASSEHTICAAIKPEDQRTAEAALEKEFSNELLLKNISPIIFEENLAVVSVVGEGMKKIPGVAGKVFSALGKHGINIIAIAQGSSELNVSAVINSDKEVQALNALHEEFFFSDTKSINVFICGTGLIGKALIKQINKHKDFLSTYKKNEVKIIGICNSKHYLLDSNALSENCLNEFITESISCFQTVGNQSSNPAKDLITGIKKLALPNSVFVDCTANEEVTKLYEEILSANISIVTPNKKAQTSSIESYKKIKNLAAKKGTNFLYETSVGAGLPVINTLNDLILSGDEIIKIEGILSGTLSYIFNSFNSSLKFSNVVKQAKELGYTEPDPRDDLNGIDVARKCLILARELGFELELSDIEVENLVPENCRATKNIAEFFTLLETHDNYFENKIATAEKNTEKLRYIACIELFRVNATSNLQVKATVKLQSVNSDHPFYSLSGSDNIISFTTNRYLNRPLVVKGPGAGAEVTAAGVFADIVRISA